MGQISPRKLELPLLTIPFFCHSMKSLWKKEGAFLSFPIYEAVPEKNLWGSLAYNLKTTAICLASQMILQCWAPHMSGEVWHQKIRKRADMLSYFIPPLPTPTSCPHVFSNFLLTCFSPVSLYQTMTKFKLSLENYARCSREVILKTHKMLLWEGAATSSVFSQLSLIGFKSKVLVYISSSYVLLLAFNRA